MARTKEENENRKLKVTKLGEVHLRNWDIRIGYDSIDTIITEKFPELKELEDEIVFNGKITILIEELEDCQCENTFKIPLKIVKNTDEEGSVVNE